MNIDNLSPEFIGLTEEKYKAILNLATPSYVIDEERLIDNGKILKSVREKCGVKILLAQKAFSNFATYKTLSKYIDGTEASGLYEARLGFEEMNEKECHVFCAAYREDEFDELLKYADHITFNSPLQLKKFGARAKAKGKSIGLRINPEFSTQLNAGIYNPCAALSRLGSTKEIWDKYMTDDLISMLDGIHFHTLCEQNSDSLKLTLNAVEEKFGKYFSNLKWINFGGGHHITKKNYDIDTFCDCVLYISKKYNVQVYIEPGEAVALNAGYLVSEVLDIVENDGNYIAILDMSAACHTPDVLEMPYRPSIMNAYRENEKKYTYRLGCPTCLAGDIIGDYSFEEKLQIKDKLLLGDMAIYSTCKNNSFNGMKLPNIYLLKKDGSVNTLAKFGYKDFKYRLGN